MGDISSLNEESWSLIKTIFQCCSTWLISFIFISPIVFKVNLFGIDLGEFGPNPLRATCNIFTCSYHKLPISPAALIDTVGFFLPLFVMLLAYIVVLPIKMKKASKNFKEGRNKILYS